MASIQETLRAVLGADSTMTTLVGDRIYPGEIPDDEATPPWLYYAVPESVPFDQLDPDEPITVRSEVEFHSLADRYGTAQAIINAIRPAIRSASGSGIKQLSWLGTSEETTEDGYHHVIRYMVLWEMTGP
jgi:hypothetical protein